MALPNKDFRFSERAIYGRRRQASKPMLERQRRARINHSLEELKNLVLSALYRESEQYSQKMEKAEILELAVNFLKMSRKRNPGSWSASRDSTESLSKYRAGYNDCSARIFHYLENDPGISEKLRENVLSQLAKFCYAAPTVDIGAASSYCSSCAERAPFADSFICSRPAYRTTAQFQSHSQVTPPASPIPCDAFRQDESVVKPEINANPLPLWRPWLPQ